MIDRYRPQIHFTAPSGWLNDPNGLVYFEGEYHLFYQHLWPRHWGQAVSTDLLHWAHLPPALAPDALGDIWSGSAVVDWQDTSGFFGGQPGLVAIFTHQNALPPPHGPQVQSLAYSADCGRTWTMYAGNPVIPNPGTAGFRDPKVFWHAPTRRWVMVTSYNDDRLRLYTSPDLKAWACASEFGQGAVAPARAWECPDLFELPIEGHPTERRWVLQVSLYHGEESARGLPLMRYFLGSFDGTTFASDDPPDAVRQVDYGPDHYAVASWSDVPAGDGRRLCIGWMNNWAYADRTPTHPWQGAMTIPRRLTLRRDDGEIRLAQEPVAELRLLHGEARRWVRRNVSPAAPLTAPVAGPALEIAATFDPATAASFGVRVWAGEAQHTTIGYDVATATLFVDRARAGQAGFSPDFPGRAGGYLALAGGRIALHIVVDRCSVEVFANDGVAAVTSLVFPDAEPTGVEVYATEGTARLVSLEIAALANVNERWKERN